MTDIKTLQKKSEKELIEFVQEQRTTIRKHRFGMGDANSCAIRDAKKDIARALTLLGEEHTPNANA